MVPHDIPKLSDQQLASLSTLSYQQICMEMFKVFTDEEFISTYDVETILKHAHKEFPPSVMPIKKIDRGAHILELFHGPTYSFKDVALSVAGPLLNSVVKRRNKYGVVY